MNEVQVNSQGNVQSVDFTSQEPIQPQRSSQTEMMVTRQAQEVQVAMLAAKKFPRDQVVAYNNIMRACQRRKLAESSMYEFPRGNEKITGPSIRLAEAIAQNWGNIDFGFMELEQRNGASQVMAYAWDLETNSRQTKLFKRPDNQITYKTLDVDSLEFLEKIEEATGVTDFITDIWPGIKGADDLEKALREIFRKQFDDMFREFTYQWVLAEDPVLATEVEEITKPAEAFIQGWSGELARIMNLNTKDAMERLLLKAQEKKWSIDELSEAIGNSGIREHGYRSRRVALTESLRVESYAQQESMIQNPLAYKKKWKHVMSAHPRENHMAMDGQEVFKREMFTLTGKNGATYMVLCPRDTSLPVEETANCHCLMETIADENALGMTAEERVAARKKYMDEVNAEYDAWEKKFKEDTGIEEPRDDPSVTWKIYNSYYEAYRKGEIA